MNEIRKVQDSISDLRRRVSSLCKEPQKKENDSKCEDEMREACACGKGRNKETR